LKDEAWQWWRHLGSASVVEAVGDAARKPARARAKGPLPHLLSMKVFEAAMRNRNMGNETGGGEGLRKTSCMTVQDLEGMMEKTPGAGGTQFDDDYSTAPGFASKLVGRTFAARPTRAIAARVNRVCLWQNSAKAEFVC